MAKGRLYRHDKETWEEVTSKGLKWDLRELQTLVGCNCLEFIPVADGTLLVDQEGNPKGLPLNGELLVRYGIPFVGDGLIVRTQDIE